MADDTDGIEEALAGQVRVALTAAGMVSEALARAREQRLRRAHASSEQEARQLASRLEAERRAARAELAAVHRPEWWNSATPEQIGRVYQLARAWAHEEPEAVRAEQRISQELRGRYGIDAARTGGDAAPVHAALEQAQQDRARGAAGRGDAATDQAEAQVLLALAAQQDRQADEARVAALHEADPDERALATIQAAVRESSAKATRGSGEAIYDSAERREKTARDLEAQGVGEAAAAARMSADVSQARPATEAVGGHMTRATTATWRTHYGAPQLQRATPER